MSGQQNDAPAQPNNIVAVPVEQAGAQAKFSNQYMQHAESGRPPGGAGQGAGGPYEGHGQMGQPEGGPGRHGEGSGQSPNDGRGIHSPSDAGGGHGGPMDRHGAGYGIGEGPPGTIAEGQKGEGHGSAARKLEEQGILPPAAAIFEQGQSGGMKNGGMKHGESCVTTPTMESITTARDGTSVIVSTSTTICKPTHEGAQEGNPNHGMPARNTFAEGGSPPEGHEMSPPRGGGGEGGDGSGPYSGGPGAGGRRAGSGGPGH